MMNHVATCRGRSCRGWRRDEAGRGGRGWQVVKKILYDLGCIEIYRTHLFFICGYNINFNINYLYI
jgi:hypothetical protein